MAVAGTANDLSVMGGKPLAMASAIVISEGFPVADLRKIIRSMNDTAKEVGVSLVTGDTKVIEKGSLDGLIITTTGIGSSKSLITDSGLSPGDDIIPIEHGRRVFAATPGPKRFLELSGGHNTAFLESERIYLEGWEAFLTEHLFTTQEPAP